MIGFLMSFTFDLFEEILRLRRWRSSSWSCRGSLEPPARKTAPVLQNSLHLIINLVCRGDILRIHLSRRELGEHLNLLHLRQCDFVAHLYRLKFSYCHLVIQLKVLQGRLFSWKFWA